MKKSIYQNVMEAGVILLLVLSFMNSAIAQSKIMTKTLFTYDSLSPAQKLKYNHVVASDSFVSHFVVNLDNNALSDPNGLLSFSVGNFLDTMVFKVVRANYKSNYNYDWYGKFIADSGNARFPDASLSILSKDSAEIGFLQAGNRTFSIYGLTGGKAILAEYSSIKYGDHNCPMAESVSEMPSESTPCGGNVTKIMIIYTPAAYAQEPSPISKAYLCLADLHNHWINSEVQNIAQIAHIQKVDGLIEDDIYQDRYTFASDPTVLALRNQYKADIVVFITTLYPQGSPQGIAMTVGATNASQGFALVALDYAVNGNHVFSHEVNHLYGGGHKYMGSGSDYNHAYSFQTGAFLGFGGTTRLTNLFTMPPPFVNIEHLSNPDVEFLNKKTGTSNLHNNARRVWEFIDPISSFYTDGFPFHVVYSLGGHTKCEQSGLAEAEADCGTPPYSYEWYYSDNGVNFSLAGSGPFMSTYVPAPYSTTMGTFNSRMYKVKATDANGQEAWAWFTAYYNCPTWNGYLTPLPYKLEERQQFSLYPNPANNQLNVHFNLKNSVSSFALEVLDITGKSLFSKEFGAAQAGSNEIHLKLPSTLNAGNYIINLSCSEFSKSLPFVKQR